MSDAQRDRSGRLGVLADNVVTFDGRPLVTPAGAKFSLPTSALASACAAELATGGGPIHLASAQMCQLAVAAQDITPERRAESISHAAKFLETDLVVHRAMAPKDLVERQERHWGPILAWGNQRLGLRLSAVAGVVAAVANPAHERAFKQAMGALDAYRCVALAAAVPLAGSALIGLALIEGEIDSDTAFTAAALDDLWSLERWGEDEEARARLQRQRDAFYTLGRFVLALREA